MERITIQGIGRVITVEGAPRCGWTVRERGDGTRTPAYLRRMQCFTAKADALRYARRAAKV